VVDVNGYLKSASVAYSFTREETHALNVAAAMVHLNCGLGAMAHVETVCGRMHSKLLLWLRITAATDDSAACISPVVSKVCIIV
jgi:hypothetical protein